MKEIVVGNPEDDKSFMGPLVSKMHLEKVLSHVEKAKEDGAQILTGGKKEEVKGLENGYFIRPTVIVGAQKDASINKEEVFGPVVTISSFEDESEAIDLANNVDYGLSATVFTNNLKRAHRVANEIEAGQVWVNTWLERDLRVPFGGVKNSGLGREGGSYSLNFFTEVKNICLDLTGNKMTEKNN